MSITQVVLDYTKAGLTNDEVYDIARIAYATVMSYLTLQDQVNRPRWLHASVDVKKRVIKSVRKIAYNLSETPAAMHEAWRQGKRANGWTYSPEYSPTKKQHPQLLTYAFLDPEKKQTDALFHSVVRSLIDFKTHT